MSFFPFESLETSAREVGLVVAVGVGFGFGFVLERAGFGRAPKLAAQFYLHDMTVFKVMFTAIVTAMLGLVICGQVGLVDLKALADAASSSTFLWPMVIGGLLLGVGFIVAGYCPGTSLVSAASGNLDGLAAFGGAILGAVVYSEAFPLTSRFHNLSDYGHLYLYELARLPPPVVALGVALMAAGCFVGAEKVERIFTRRMMSGAEPPAELWPRSPRRFAFATFAALAAVGLAGLALPRSTASAHRASVVMSPRDLAQRVIDEPWRLRILDLRAKDACAASRVPGAECAPPESLGELGLADDAGGRDLVLVGEGDLADPPPAVAGYPGRVFALKGGFEGWKAYALTPPPAPAANATAQELAELRLRGAVNAAMTGAKQQPPPAAPAGGGTVAPPKKKKGGGCS